MPLLRSVPHVAVVVLCCVLLAVHAQDAPRDEDDSLVHTQWGTLQGTSSVLGRKFLGIPYAKPPVGSLRWRPAQPWTDMYDASPRDATQFGARCYDADDHSTRSVSLPASEDCLFVNVYTPPVDHTNPERKYPVYVWIHGGSFMYGTGAAFDGQYLSGIADEIIVVTINYRLGALGYIALDALIAEDEHDSTGNYGITDQVEALKWVADNIHYFNGDPEKVTVGGESAGGISVMLINLLSSAAPFYSASIVESGPPQLNTLDETRQVSMNLVQHDRVKCDAGHAADVLECMRGKDPALLASINVLVATSAVTSVNFFPTIDGYMFRDNPMLQYQRGEYNQKPMLAGGNTNEGTIFVYELVRAPLSITDYKAFVSTEFGDNADRVLELYPVGGDADDHRPQLSAVMGDQFFKCPMYRVADWNSLSHATYQYHFDQEPSCTVPPDWAERGPIGVYHASELQFLFPNQLQFNPGCQTSEPEVKLSEYMASYWAAFVAHHDPNVQRDRDPELPNWPLYTPTHKNVQTLRAKKADGSGGIVTVPDGYLVERCALFDEVGGYYTPAKKHTKLSGAAVAFITMGVIVGALVIGGLVYTLSRKRNPDQDAESYAEMGEV